MANLAKFSLGPTGTRTLG